MQTSSLTTCLARSHLSRKCGSSGEARLGIESVANRSLWQPALTRALSSGAAVHDTLFVELAVQRSLPLATFDKNVLKRFPEIAHRPGSLPSN